MNHRSVQDRGSHVCCPSYDTQRPSKEQQYARLAGLACAFARASLNRASSCALRSALRSHRNCAGRCASASHGRDHRAHPARHRVARIVVCEPPQVHDLVVGVVCAVQAANGGSGEPDAPCHSRSTTPARCIRQPPCTGAAGIPPPACARSATSTACPMCHPGLPVPSTRSGSTRAGNASDTGTTSRAARPARTG